MSDKATSDLSLNRVECPHCEAVWMNGKHYWSTGAVGNESDLAGLVCNTTHGCKDKCINPAVGREGGDTWEDRMKFLNSMTQTLGDQSTN